MELQLELSKQETTRLRSQVDHLSQSVDQARASLSEVHPFILQDSLMLTADRNGSAPLRQSLLKPTTTC